MSDNPVSTNRLEDEDLNQVSGGFTTADEEYYVVKGESKTTGEHIYEGSLSYAEALKLCEYHGMDPATCIIQVPSRIDTIF